MENVMECSIYFYRGPCLGRSQSLFWFLFLTTAKLNMAEQLPSVCWHSLADPHTLKGCSWDTPWKMLWSAPSISTEVLVSVGREVASRVRRKMMPLPLYFDGQYLNPLWKCQNLIPSIKQKTLSLPILFYFCIDMSLKNSPCKQNLAHFQGEIWVMKDRPNQKKIRIVCYINL